MLWIASASSEALPDTKRARKFRQRDGEVDQEGEGDDLGGFGGVAHPPTMPSSPRGVTRRPVTTRVLCGTFTVMPTGIHRQIRLAEQNQSPRAICRLASGWVIAGEVQHLARLLRGDARSGGARLQRARFDPTRAVRAGPRLGGRTRCWRWRARTASITKPGVTWIPRCTPTWSRGSAPSPIICACCRPGRPTTGRTVRRLIPRGTAPGCGRCALTWRLTPKVDAKNARYASSQRRARSTSASTCSRRDAGAGLGRDHQVGARGDPHLNGGRIRPSHHSVVEH